MAVKRSQSAGRMLSVFEHIARLQPIGVSALARALEADRSAVQRDLMTLADAGWIRQVAGTRGSWELSLHILTLVRPPHSSGLLRKRLRPVLEWLRTETDETVYLTVPHQNRFVVLDALESRHMLRVVPPVGIIVPVEGSATARAILPYLSPAAQQAILGGEPSAALRAEYAKTLDHGYAVNDGDLVPGSVAVASAIFGPDRRPCGAIVLTGPSDRLGPARWAEIGRHLKHAADLATQIWPAESLIDPMAQGEMA